MSIKYAFAFVIQVLSIFIFMGCKKTEESSEIKYYVGSYDRTSKEFLIPRALREHIEQEYLTYLKSQKTPVILTDEEILSRIPREYLDVELMFHEAAPGALVQNTKFVMPRGGGEIDLKDYVKGRKGSFFMKFSSKRSSDPNNPVQDLRVYFLSEARSRTLDGQKFGSGCKVHMDLSKYLNGVNAGEGLQLNATEQRYVSVIGGVFYFVEFTESRKIYLAAIRVTDSRYPELFCKDEK